MLKKIVNQMLVYWLGALVIFVDQVAKHLVRTRLALNESWSPFPWLAPYARILHIQNTGAAFGMFKNIGSSFFIAASAVAIIFVIYLLIKRKENYLGLSLILGGTIGNLTDRILYGRVVDFIDLSIGRYHWPAFNIADSALSIGVTIILLTHLFKPTKAKRSAKQS